MRQGANVSSINALKEFKHGLTEFATITMAALDEAQSDVQRTLWWVQHEQLSYWKGHKKKIQKKLDVARSELFRAQVASPDQRVPATSERKAVERAERELEEADTKIANVKRWTRLLEREVLLYKGQCQGLSHAVEGELPRALGRLERMIVALEKYVRLAAPEMDEAIEEVTAEEADE